MQEYPNAQPNAGESTPVRADARFSSAPWLMFRASSNGFF